ncbi:HlyD family secretion protein [Undibacterium luofuense]|uniref:HlyD family efflux transporter periplasmic adaptor subunit n=1 Tax=Undibacterium luofuense TaxID=2828733 RepID=A0A941DL69_9BURK|nr:HlyD family efflux transporter periplasmic adaptor subunit [Undibacterium luofuense]MBR7781850.1 HlyD family efflux transporter periplasmic adaptor subunit [Undibacterium luofuense]
MINGHLEPRSGLVTISSGVQGSILSVGATDGQMVAKGQPIFEIGTDKYIGGDSTARRVQISIDEQKLTLKREISLREQQSKQRGVALTARVNGLMLQRANSAQDLALSRERLLVTEAEWQRSIELGRNGLVPKSQVQQKELENLEAKSRVANSERVLAMIDLDIQSARSELEGLKAQLGPDIENLKRSLAANAQASVEAAIRSGLTITAPVAGMLTLLHRNVGEAAQVNQILATITPAVDVSESGQINLVATLFAPSRSIGFIRPKQSVVIKYQAFPYEKYGVDFGVVENVSPVAVALQDLPVMYQRQAAQRGADVENYYKIVVTLSGKATNRYRKELNLKAGMIFEAEIRQDERYVWEWIFDPFLRARTIF